MFGLLQSNMPQEMKFSFVIKYLHPHINKKITLKTEKTYQHKNKFSNHIPYNYKPIEFRNS